MSVNSVKVHAFCRELLKQTMIEVREVYTPEQIKAAWVWDSGGGRKQFEFHGPNKEYIYNLDADCRWSAAASGWSKLLYKREQKDSLAASRKLLVKALRKTKLVRRKRHA